MHVFTDHRSLSVASALGLVACLYSGCFHSDELLYRRCVAPSEDCDPAGSEVGAQKRGCFTPQGVDQDGYCALLCGPNSPCPETEGSITLKCILSFDPASGPRGVCAISADNGCPEGMGPVDTLSADGATHSLCAPD